MSVQPSSSTATTTTTQQIHITEPSLSVFHHHNQVLTDEILELHAKVFPVWEARSKKLEKFEVTVRNRASDLQHERVVTPEKTVLEGERDKFLTKYWKYKETCETVEQYGLNLLKTIESLTPRVRTYTEVQNLLYNAPQLLSQITAVDEVSLKQITLLKEVYTKVKGLQDKMMTFITSKVDSSVQRFCQIVDNEGKPISVTLRLIDNVTTPVVPKPASMSLASIALAEGKSNSSEKKDNQ